MDFKGLFQKDSAGYLLAHIGTALGVLLVLCLLYFYAYLPIITNHNETVMVVDLKGIKADDARRLLQEHHLRYAINDSAYSEDLPPLTVLKQYPRAGSKVKENRVIYLSLNRKHAPTLPMPELVDRSLINAEVVLKSNELKRGKIYYQSSRYQNLVLDARYQGASINANTRIPKGSVIDLVVGNGTVVDSLDLGVNPPEPEY